LSKLSTLLTSLEYPPTNWNKGQVYKILHDMQQIAIEARSQGLNYREVYQELQLEYLKKGASNNESYIDLGKAHLLKPSTVERLLFKAGHPRTKTKAKPRGGTETIRAPQIIKDRLAGMTIRELAETYAMTRSGICKLLRRHRERESI
jgi:hypothetical protein